MGEMDFLCVCTGWVGGLQGRGTDEKTEYVK